jgi:hypothetical protein
VRRGCCEWVFTIYPCENGASFLCVHHNSKVGQIRSLHSHPKVLYKIGSKRLQISCEQKVIGNYWWVELTSAPEKGRLAPSRLGWSLWYTLAPSARNTTGYLKSNKKDISTRVADPGCLSRIRLFSIPDPGSIFSFHPGSRIPDPNQRI